MENLRFSFVFYDSLYCTVFILIRGFLFTIFTLKGLLSVYYYCKSFLPTIGGLDPRVPPGSVLLYSTAKLAPTWSTPITPILELGSELSFSKNLEEVIIL